MEHSFNLWDEPWIRVMDGMCRVTEVSLTDALVNAHQYAALAGENPAQDVALLRLLVAVVHTVFYRVDEKGTEAMLEDEDDALDRWDALWRGKALPEGPILAYRERWRDRFDLLDPVRPFYQVPEAAIPDALREKQKWFTAAKLNGNILESKNKRRIFSSRSSESSKSLGFEEGARWLFYLNAFDDCSIDPKFRKEIGTGWLGQLGVIYATGDNLFETIMLNMVLLNWNQELYAQPKPSWELDQAKTGDRTKIAVPDNIPQLFTLQSRRVNLKWEESVVVGYVECGGDILESQDAFSEPMTVWKAKKDNTGYIPKLHDPSKQLWREFSTIAIRADQDCRPGVAVWLAYLQYKKLLGKEFMARFTTVGVEYHGTTKCAVDDIFSDTLAFHAGLLTDAGTDWQALIRDQIELTDRVADCVARLAGELALAAGKTEKENKRVVSASRMSAAKKARTQYYYRVDQAFRQWLLRPDAEQDGKTKEALCMEWRGRAVWIAQTLGRELVDEAGPAAMKGRWVTEDEKEQKKRHYSAAEATNRFSARLNQLKKEGV